MKRTILLGVILFLCAIGAKAQTVKTAEAYELEKVNKALAQAKADLVKLESSLPELQKEYAPTSPEIAEIKKDVAQTKSTIADLTKQRDDLAKKALRKPVPNDSTELLKIIVLQNERIIELLEQKQN